MAVAYNKAEQKADVFEAMLERAGFDLEEVDLLECYDMNGPLTDTADADLPVHDSVMDTFDEVKVGDENYAALVSGHPIDNLRFFRDERLETDRFGIVGELGSVIVNGGTQLVHPDQDPRKLWSIYQDLYENAATEEVKLLPQHNVSNVVGCVRVEGEGSPEDERSGLYKQADVRAQETADIAAALGPYDDFTYDGDRITFDNTLQNAAILTTVLREEFSYPGIRFETTDDDRISCYRDPTDDEEMTLDEAHRFVLDVLPDTVDSYINDDWGVDFVTHDDVSKETGARALGDSYFDDQDYVITHVGDKTSDVMTGDDTFIFPQYGSQAHEYCLQHGIAHIPVDDGAEYASILSTVIDRQETR